jgi:hypothetical protein
MAILICRALYRVGLGFLSAFKRNVQSPNLDRLNLFHVHAEVFETRKFVEYMEGFPEFKPNSGW